MNVQEARFRKPAADETSEQLLLDPSPSFIQRTGAVAAVAAATWGRVRGFSSIVGVGWSDSLYCGRPGISLMLAYLGGDCGEA